MPPCTMQLVQGAEATALYGLVLNYKPLQALVDRLINDSTLTGEQVGQTLEGAGLRYFPDPFVDGFTWGQDGTLIYPGQAEQVCNMLTFYMNVSMSHQHPAEVWFLSIWSTMAW